MFYKCFVQKKKKRVVPSLFSVNNTRNLVGFLGILERKEGKLRGSCEEAEKGLGVEPIGSMSL